NKLLRIIYTKWMKFKIMKYSTHLLGCSEKACEILYGSEWRKDNRVEVLKNGISVSSYENIVKDTGDLKLRKEISISDNAKLVGKVGRFVKVKNHQKIILVFKEMMDSNNPKDLHLVLVGGGDLKKEVVDQVKKYKLEKN